MQKNNTSRLTPITLTILLVITVLCFLDMANASYKKPPFNGSIFGKRANGVTDYDTAGRTLASLCEIASEACSAWFPDSTK